MVDPMSSAWRHETLQTLASLDAQAAEARTRISTGRKVHSALDNGGAFAIAVGLRADEAGAKVRMDALDRVSSILDIAIAGVEGVSDLLIEMRANAVVLADSSLDAQTITEAQQGYLSLYKQALSIVDAAEFAEVNLLDGSSTSFSSIALDVSIQGYDLGDALSGGANADMGGIIASGFSGVAPPNPDGTGTSAEFLALIGEIDTLLEGVGSIGAAIGALGEAANIQNTYLTELADTFKAGRGKLVDADIDSEMARLRSLSIRRELAAQFVPITSRGPEVVLRLFSLY